MKVRRVNVSDNENVSDGVSDNLMQGEREVVPAAVRREQIRRLIDERGFVRVSELRETFGVSGVTARADLDALVAAGHISRVHGGAMPTRALARGRTDREPSFEESLTFTRPTFITYR